MRLSIAFLLVFSLSIFCAAAQKTSTVKSTVKKETDRDLRKLAGPVHYVRIQRKLVKSTDGKSFDGGWVPSLTVYNRDGFIRELFAYYDNGLLDYKSISEFDSSGNKIRESTRYTKEKVNREKFMTYNARGNLVETKSFDNSDGSFSSSVKFSYDGKGILTHYYHFNREGDALSLTRYLYDRAGKRKEETSYYPLGKLINKAIWHYKKRNEEMLAFDGQGVFSRRYVSLVNKRGDLTEIGYDKDGKPTHKDIYTYERDARGNWIKETCSQWEGENGKVVFKRTKITRRQITYY